MDGTLAHGSRVGRYRIDAVVARGGMGIVYRATDAALERPVALKVIAPELARDEDFRARFVRESRLAAALDHPNVIPVYEAGDEDGTLFIAMRFVEGRDLREVIGLDGRLDPQRATRIVAQVASALDAAHARGLVHRDVKPANVLLAGSPGEEHVYLTDFGIAKRQDTSGLTQTGHMLGTVDYAAPEQMSGETVDARTDVYALGCLLCEALTGEVPFPRATAPAAMVAHLHERPPVLSERAAELGTSFDRVLGRALAKSPGERFPSAGDLGAAAIAAVRGATPIEPEETVARGPAAAGMAASPAPHSPFAPPTLPAVPGSFTPPDVAAPPDRSTPPTLHAPPGSSTPPGVAAPPDRSTPPTLHAAASPPPSEPPSSASRRRWPLALAGVLLLIAGVAAALLLTGALGTDDGGDRAKPRVRTPSVASPTTTAPSTPTAPAQPGRPVPEAQANALADRYVAAYEAEDLDAMRAILAPGAQLSGPGTSANGREEVLSEYRSTFALIENPRYELGNRTYAVQPTSSTVQGDYDVTDSATGSSPSGRLTLTMQLIDGKPLITSIVTTG